MIIVKLTSNPIKVMYTLKFDNGTSTADIVAESKEKWETIHDRVKKDHSPYAMAFAEVYNPEYNDEASGELTIALDKATGREVKPITTKPVVAVVKAKAKPAVVEKPKVISAEKTLSKAAQVRELIKSNPKSDADTLIALAVDTLSMPMARAKVYVKENLNKIRG